MSWSQQAICYYYVEWAASTLGMDCIHIHVCLCTLWIMDAVVIYIMSIFVYIWSWTGESTRVFDFSWFGTFNIDICFIYFLTLQVWGWNCLPILMKMYAWKHSINSTVIVSWEWCHIKLYSLSSINSSCSGHLYTSDTADFYLPGLFDQWLVIMSLFLCMHLFACWTSF